MESRPLATDDVADLYDELIEVYEREWDRQDHRSLHLGYYDDDHQEDAAAAINTMRVLATAAEVDADDRVLNVGCGAGADSVYLARAHGADVVGVNISESQLTLAREHAENQGVADHTDFRYDDFHELATVEDGSVDVYWGLEALTHSDDVPAALSQARRVLAPGGRLAIADLFTPSAPSDAVAADLRTIEDALGVRFGSIDGFRSALAEAGFEDVAVRNATTNVEPATKRRYTFSRIAGYAGPVLKRIGFFSDAQVDAIRASKLLHERVADGSLGYYVLTADAPTAS
jgi:cyclopropane fatty-acyl-phospholipid synthase-like methyltransferase